MAPRRPLPAAQASGLPPVVTAVGGNRAVLGEQLAGQLVPAGDVEGLAAGIEKMLAGEAAADIASSCRLRVERDFNLATMVAAYEAVYEALASQGVAVADP